jgi:N-acetylmuramoyl-L-alanine amidase
VARWATGENVAKYFHSDGIVIHGYPSVPAYPASHGCARVTMPAMNFIWENDLAPQGSTVIVYGRG